MHESVGMCLHGPPHVSVCAFVDTFIFVFVHLKHHPSGFGCFDPSPENRVLCTIVSHFEALAYYSLKTPLKFTWFHQLTVTCFIHNR